ICPFPRNRSRGSRHANFEGLAEVAQVHRPVELMSRGGKALPVECGGGPFGESGEENGYLGDVETVVPADVSLHVVVLDIDGEQAVRRDVAGIMRDDDTGQVKNVDEGAGEQGAGATEGREHEVANIKSPLDGNLAQGIGLVPSGDLEDTGRSLLRRKAKSFCDLFDTSL